MYDLFIAALLGLTSGFFTGFTGISSAGIILAGLSLSQIIKDYKIIMGTILYLLLFPVTSGSVWEFYKAKKINFLIGNILLISSFIGAFLGSKIVLNADLKISEKTIKYTTSAIALTIGAYFFYSASIL